MGVARLLRRRPQRNYDAWIKAAANKLIWYKCNESSGNLTDSSGNSRTGTVTGSPTYEQTGPFGGCKAIKWVTDAWADAATFPNLTGSDWTVEGWVRWDTNTSVVQPLVCHINGSGAPLNTAQCGVDATGTAQQCVDIYTDQVKGGATLTTGVWRFMGWTYRNSDKRVQLYQGIVVHEGNLGTAPTFNANKFRIADINGSGDPNYQGKSTLAHVVVYDRVLSLGEIILRTMFGKGG